jgi:hypothetical protein
MNSKVSTLIILALAACLIPGCSEDCDCPDVIVSGDCNSDSTWPDWSTPLRIIAPGQGDTLTVDEPFLVTVAYPKDLPAQTVNLYRFGSTPSWGSAFCDVSGSITFQAEIPFPGETWLYVRIATTSYDTLSSGQVKVFFESQ